MTGGRDTYTSQRKKVITDLEALTTSKRVIVERKGTMIMIFQQDKRVIHLSSHNPENKITFILHLVHEQLAYLPAHNFVCIPCYFLV